MFKQFHTNSQWILNEQTNNQHSLKPTTFKSNWLWKSRFQRTTRPLEQPLVKLQSILPPIISDLSKQQKAHLPSTELPIILKNRSTATPLKLIHQSMRQFATQIKNTVQNPVNARNSIQPEVVKTRLKTTNNQDNPITPFEVLLHGYLWHRVVARGSFSTLYEASRLFITGRVACKHVRLGEPSSSSSSSKPKNSANRWRQVMQKHFLEEEIRILLKIRHENIVPVYEIIVSDQQKDYYIMMKFAVNKTIHDYLYRTRQNPLPEMYAKRWTGQLMTGLDYLHQKELIAHRDLKLENFLLDEKSRALLSDFGLAICLSLKRNSSEDSSDSEAEINNRLLLLQSVQCGTLEYMAPEVHLHHRQLDEDGGYGRRTSLKGGGIGLFCGSSRTSSRPWHFEDDYYDPFKADIYSMGICLFEMVNYRRPFRWTVMDDFLPGSSSFGQNPRRSPDSGSKENLLWKQRHRIYEFNKKVFLTADCHQLIWEMLEPRPEFRPNAHKVLQHQWFKHSIR